MLSLPIHTPRTAVRLPIRSDMRSWCAVDRSKRVREFLDGPLWYSATETWSRIEPSLQDRPTAQFAIILNSTYDFVGQCGFLSSDQHPREVEYWCALRAKYWRKGLAIEVASAMICRAFAELDVDRIIGVVHPGNLASIALVSKIGFAHVGTLEGAGWQNGHPRFQLSQQMYARVSNSAES